VSNFRHNAANTSYTASMSNLNARKPVVRLFFAVVTFGGIAVLSIGSNGRAVTLGETIPQTARAVTQKEAAASGSLSNSLIPTAKAAKKDDDDEPIKLAGVDTTEMLPPVVEVPVVIRPPAVLPPVVIRPPAVLPPVVIRPPAVVPPLVRPPVAPPAVAQPAVPPRATNVGTAPAVSQNSGLQNAVPAAHASVAAAGTPYNRLPAVTAAKPQLLAASEATVAHRYDASHLNPTTTRLLYALAGLLMVIGILMVIRFPERLRVRRLRLLRNLS